MTLIETRKSRDIQSDNDYEDKIPYMQLHIWYFTLFYMVFYFILYGFLTNEKSRLFGTFVVPCYFYETKRLHAYSIFSS